MAKTGDIETKVIACRMSLGEYGEIEDYLQRAGVGRSDFMRDALLAKVRGATTFAELLPSIAASLERQMGELARLVTSQTNGIQTLAAAAVASSAMMLDDGKAPPAETARMIEDQIKRAVSFAPEVVNYLAKPAQSPAPAGQRGR